MKHFALSVLALLSMTFGFSQLSQPVGTQGGGAPVFGAPSTKAPGDSCGVYVNNYVPIEKTQSLFFEDVRLGTVAVSSSYSGRAQRFNAPQPIEVHGITFYAFETNPGVDSVMSIVHLYDHEPIADTVGALLAVDTVWVTAQAFSVLLPSVQVDAYFDTPVTVTEDYMVAIFTPDDDSLKILASDFAGGDGNGEGVSYLFYGNPNYSGFIGWYNSWTDFGMLPNYDGDYLISPRVKYDLNDGFLLTDDTICPGLMDGCVTYVQHPVYGDPHYNSESANQDQHILWLWGDGFQNNNLLTACHTYASSGDYTISLEDTLFRYDAFTTSCVGSATEMIHVLADPVANFTFIQTASTVDFTSTSTNADSLWWDFGDMSAGTDSLNPTHEYDTLDTFNVTLIAYNECTSDTIIVQVTTDDVGFDDYNFDFKVYPNPANDNVTVGGLDPGAQVELINILGETILRDVSTSNNMTLPTYDFSNGTYFIRVSTEQGQVTKKLVIRH